MKKSIIIAAVALSAGFFTSCTKDNSVKPASVTATKVYNNGEDPKNLGSGDGTPPTPPPPAHKSN
jgi:hypothetical protein